jgi:photosystem I P700 chlorophyll a apoprotein A2
LNSAALVNAYSSTQLSDVAVYEFLFLAAHLSWATGFMFLISWRGYWQEFIDSLLWLHLKTGFVYDLWKGALPPAALSIVQARLAGLAHFAAGFILTYAAFTVGATS